MLGEAEITPPPYVFRSIHYLNDWRNYKCCCKLNSERKIPNTALLLMGAGEQWLGITDTEDAQQRIYSLE